MKKKKDYEYFLKTDKSFYKWCCNPLKKLKLYGVNFYTWKKPPKGYEGLYKMLTTHWDTL